MPVQTGMCFIKAEQKLRVQMMSHTISQKNIRIYLHIYG